MGINEASALIATRHDQGVIDRATAAHAQTAIREKSYYGQSMTADERRRMLANRFGIVADATFLGMTTVGGEQFATYTNVSL